VLSAADGDDGEEEFGAVIFHTVHVKGVNCKHKRKQSTHLYHGVAGELILA